MKNTFVISAFPGTGKSWVTNHQSELGVKCCDSDSSLFHWTHNKPDIKIKNPLFPNNYMDHIESCIGIYDFVFVSSHDIVREAMRNRGIPYILVYPKEDLKDEYIGRYFVRGNDTKFMDTLNQFWDSWINECRCDIGAKIKIELMYHDSYMSDIVQFLNKFDLSINLSSTTAPPTI